MRDVAFGLHPTMQVVNIHWGESFDFFVTFSVPVPDIETSSVSQFIGYAYGSKDGKNWIHFPDVPVPPNQHIPTDANTYAVMAITDFTPVDTRALEPNDRVTASFSFSGVTEFNEAVDGSPGVGSSGHVVGGVLHDWNVAARRGDFGSKPAGGDLVAFCAVPTADTIVVSSNAHIGYGGKDSQGKNRWLTTGFSGFGGRTQLVIYRSANAAQSWSVALDTGQTTDFSAARPTPIGFIKAELDNGICVGCVDKNNQPLHSLNGGSSWTPLALPGYSASDDSISGTIKVQSYLFVYGSKLWRTNDGVIWQQISNPFPDKNITGITYHKPKRSDDPNAPEQVSKYVIVATSGNTLHVATSEDSDHFVQTASITVSQSDGARSNAVTSGNGMLVAAWGGGDKVTVYTSSDGSAWSERTVSPGVVDGKTMVGIAFSRNMFVVVGDSVVFAGLGSSTYIWSSEDGKTWIERLKLDGGDYGIHAQGIALGHLNQSDLEE